MLGWELPPHNSGGLGVACYKLCKSLSKKGADIEFIVPYSGEYDESFMKVTNVHDVHYDRAENKLFPYDGIKTEYKNGHISYDIAGELSFYEDFITKLVELNDYDVVHAHDWLTFRAGLRAKEISSIPLVLHVHSIEKDRSGGHGNPFIREVEETTMYLADKIIAISGKTKQDIIDEYGIPAERIEVVHNSIDQEDFYMDHVSGNSYQGLIKLQRLGYRIVTNVGRMTIQKGLPNLLYAAKAVIDRSPKTLFVFVGDGEMHNELIELSAKLGISKNVLFAGFQRGKRWRDAYQVCDLFVMPSVSEPFGLTPLEATGYHKPSLISKQSGVSEVLKNCLKVDYWDVKEMANHIAGVVQHDGLAKVLAANAYEEYKKMSWNNSAESVINVYNDKVGIHVGQTI